MKYLGKDPEVLKQFVTATASGAISAGDPTVINSDGTASPVIETSQTEAVASPVIFDNNESGQYFVATKDPTEDKFAVFYEHNDGFQSNDSDKYVAFASVSGSTISVSTPLSLTTQGPELHASDAKYLSDGKVIYTFRSNRNGETILPSLRSFVVTPDYTANTISKGTELDVHLGTGSVQVGNGGIMSGPDSANKLVTYWTESPANGLRSVVLSVSGTSISKGSEYVVTGTSSYPNYFSATYDSDNDKHIAVYVDPDNSNYLTAKVGTVSGTAISWGSAVVIDSKSHYPENFQFAKYFPEIGKIAVVTTPYVSSSNTQGTVFLGEVSGTSTTWGSAQNFVNNYVSRHSAVYDANAQKIVVTYYDHTLSKTRFQSGSVSGTTITWDTAIDAGFPRQTHEGSSGLLYDSASEKVITFVSSNNNSTPYYPQAIVYATGFEQTNLTSENFIGFADKDYVDGADAVIQAKGAVNDKQTSLTAGQSYFVQGDGTLGTTADDPSVFAGTAVSATQLIVKG